MRNITVGALEILKADLAIFVFICISFNLGDWVMIMQCIQMLGMGR